MMTIKISKYHLILFLLVLFLGITNWIVLKQDNVPFCYDEGGIYATSRIYYHDLIENFTWNLKKLFYLYWVTTPFYPPLYMLSHLPLFFLFGKSQDVAAMTNTIFLAILIFSIYGIGKKIKDEQTGLFASIIVSTFPVIFGFSRTDFAVIALASLVTLSIYLLLKTENFINREYTILFGISMGLGILTKLTYPIYIAAPLLFYVLANVKRMTKRQIGNLFLSLGIGLFISSTWLAPNLITGSFFREKQLLLGRLLDEPFATKFSAVYLKLLWKQLYPVYALLLVICFLFFIFLKAKQKYLLLSWFIIPLVFFLPLWHKEARCVFPILPAGGLIISSIIGKIKVIRIRILAYFSVMIFGLSQLFFLSFKAISEDQFREEQYIQRRENGLLSAYNINWPVEEIIDLFADYKLAYKENGKPARIIVIARSPLISHLTYRIRLPTELGRIVDDDMPLNFIPVLIWPHIQFRMKINNADYVLIEEGIGKMLNQDPSFNWKTYKHYLENLKREVKENRYRYNLLTTVEGKNIRVYINKKTDKDIKDIKKRE